MKKTIAILLVAIMAVGSVFATFSGEASIGFGGNLDNGNFGFIDTGAKVKVDFDLSTASVDTTPTETVAEDGTVTPAPSIYAAVKGSLGVKLYTGEENVDEIEDPGSGLLNGAKLSVIADITEATIGGQNWSGKADFSIRKNISWYARTCSDRHTVRADRRHCIYPDIRASFRK